MPLAMEAMEKATGKTAQELSKMMEMGQLGVDVLPAFGRELRKLANEGGALDKALESVRVTEARFITQAQKSADKIFQSGFGEGLSDLYQTMTNILKDAGPQLEKMGKMFGNIFKGIAHILKLIEPPLKFMINNIEYLTSAYIIGRLASLRMALFRTFLPITAALGAAEELISLFSDKIVGVTESQLGYQINLSEGTTSDLYRKDGKLFSKSPEDFIGKMEEKFGGFFKAAEIIGKYNPTQLLPSMFSSGDTVTTTKQVSPTSSNPVYYVTNDIQIQADSEEIVYGALRKFSTEAYGR